jgi:hypothetical protein
MVEEEAEVGGGNFCDCERLVALEKSKKTARG